MRLYLLLCLLLPALVAVCAAADEPVSATEPAAPDTLVAGAGRLVVHPFGHASLALQWGDLTVAVDPVGDARRWSHLPRPGLILVTHRHGDHFDPDCVRDLAGEHTLLVTPPDVAESIPANDPIALVNGDTLAIRGVTIAAVPAHNRTEGRLDFHPAGRDNGYVLDFRGCRVYLSGDTEDLPVMAEFGPLDAAFLCMNLPWTMSGSQAAAAARALRPRVLYPYHFRNRDGTFTDLEVLRRELVPGAVAEVRILNWY